MDQAKLERILLAYITNLTTKESEALTAGNVELLKELNQTKSYAIQALGQGSQIVERVVWNILRRTVGELVTALEDSQPNYSNFVGVFDVLNTYASLIDFQATAHEQTTLVAIPGRSQPAVVTTPQTLAGGEIIPPDQQRVARKRGPRKAHVAPSDEVETTAAAQAEGEPKPKSYRALNLVKDPEHTLRAGDLMVVRNILTGEPRWYTDIGLELWPGEFQDEVKARHILRQRVYYGLKRALEVIRNVWDSDEVLRGLDPDQQQFYADLKSIFANPDAVEAEIVRRSKKKDTEPTEKKAVREPVKEQQPPKAPAARVWTGIPERHAFFISKALLDDKPTLNKEEISRRAKVTVGAISALQTGSLRNLEEALSLEPSRLSNKDREIVDAVRGRWPGLTLEQIFAELESTTR